MSFNTIYEQVPLGSLAKFINGDRGENYPKPTDYVASGIPFVSATDIDGGYIAWKQSKKISPASFASLRRGRVQRGDILFCLRGSLGKLGYVEEEIEGAIASSLVILRAESLSLSKYLRFVLCSPQVQEAIKSLDNGSVQGNISAAALKNLLIPLPPMAARVAITSALEAVEGLIDLNRRINRTLEAMAQATFKSWFVDFDPAKAKIAAKAEGSDPLRAAMSAVSGKTDGELDALSPEQHAHLAATAALFPDEMEESELGEIPKGWSVCGVPDCIEVNPSRTLKKGALAPYLDMANVPTHAARVDNVVLRAFGSGSKFINGDTLLARITPCLENGKTAYVDFLDEGEVGWGSTEFIVLRPKAGLPLPFAYFLCRHPEFRSFAISQMAGTSGRQRVPNDCFGAYRLAKPSSQVADAFGQQVTLFMKQIKAQDQGSKTLAEVRDALLPRLLSGELQVQNIHAEAAA